ncbi:protein-glutamate methylesterase/protein-glutamine glutaminase [Robertmurraya kyonggiensis]|uniref:Protein-glutamate methylesterase/protein-glutamine glutaminase n=1 Tax=Robertmurraya kyonggiensis TaxID=1037680 RepID=A0A4U1D7W7_9BACI|nr:chemotaxis response regulator protein-glutamate methylesterase [Robertmurraya kyonggiensis]TKC18675.1 chemotaxis response regulator protein-glutamate methylesterase [Robertmurraya kyonggiensis]
MQKIKVLIVDDSAFMRKLIQDFLSEHPSIEVISTARNGEDALKKIKTLSPDVVTMDVEMPVLNGIEALKKIMNEHPVPVLMLSSTTKQGAENTIQAMALGAIDFIAKPSGAISLDLYKVKEELIQKVISASKANLTQLSKDSNDDCVKRTIPPSEECSKIERKGPLSGTREKTISKKLICIGTSTGGPRALQQVVTRLPKNIDVPVFIVQHMPAGFTKSLAERLNSLSECIVKEAVDGEIAERGTIYIAPGGFHLTVKEMGTSLKIQLDDVTPPRGGHRPSVDVMFESISDIKTYSKIAVIMTGMGSDGSQGLIELKKTGVVTAIAESQETSIVYGMPKAAAATKLVDEVQNVEKIAETILRYI